MDKMLMMMAMTFNTYAGNCNYLYPNETEWRVPNTLELCSSFFVSRYDADKKANIMSIEILKANHKAIERGNDFHPDPRLQKSQRAEVKDYANTGFDKGHMTPAGDAATPDQMSETFIMTNMTPQVPSCNRNGWRMLEENTRKLVNSRGKDVFVITAAVYKSNKLMNGVPIPTGYYKVVYTDPKYVFYADNVDHCMVRDSTIAEFEKDIGSKLP